MNPRRDLPVNASDVARLRARYELALALLGFAAATLRLVRVVRS